jgi:general stress protein 26
MNRELAKMYELIEKIETAILVTRRADGHLVARPMAKQADAPGADLWFVTAAGSGKLDDLEHDDHVNVTFYRSGKYEWVSIAGIAHTSQDRQRIRTLWRDDWRMWFGDAGDPRHGTPDDPRLVLIGVDVHSAVFLEQDQPAPAVLFELVKGFFKKEEPDLGTMHHVSGEDAERR